MVNLNNYLKIQNTRNNFLLVLIILLIGINFDFITSNINPKMQSTIGYETIQKTIILCITLFLIKTQFITKLLKESLFITVTILLLITILFTRTLLKDSITAYSGFVLGLLLLQINFYNKNIIAFLKLLPIISIGGRLLLSLFINLSLFRNEFDVGRLQGLISPAHLALLCFNLIFLVCFQLLEKYTFKDLILLITYFLIIILTKSRTAIFLSLILTIYFSFLYFNKRKFTLATRRLSILIILMIGFILSFLLYDIIVSRSTEYTDTEIGINTSGRSEIWSFYLSKLNNEVNYIGMGTGYIKSIDTSSLSTNVKNVHNEYLRIYIENGIIGIILYIIGFISHFLSRKKRLYHGSINKKFYSFYFLLIFIYSITDNYFTTISSWLSYCIIISIITPPIIFIKNKTNDLNHNSKF